MAEKKAVASHHADRTPLGPHRGVQAEVAEVVANSGWVGTGHRDKRKPIRGVWGRVT